MTVTELGQELDRTLAQAGDGCRLAAEIRDAVGALAGAAECLWRRAPSR